MGLFSGKTRVTVASTAINLIADTPDVVKDSVIVSLIEGKNISRGLLATLSNGLGTRMRQVLAYAESDYTHGLPEGTVQYTDGDNAAVKAVIEAEIGETIEIFFNIVDLPKPDVLARPYLVEVCEWDPETNEVGNPPFTPVYEPTSPVTLVSVVDKGGTSNVVTITYSYEAKDSINDPFGDPFTVTKITEHSLGSVDFKVPYYHVGYFILDEGVPVGGLHYWSYKSNSGLHPTLDLPAGTPLNKPYYPIIPMRYNNQDMAREDVKNTELFITSKKLLSKAGIDMELLAEEINKNPSINDIDHAFIHFGVDLHTESPAGIRYLFEFFLYLKNTAQEYNLASGSTYALSQYRFLPSLPKFSKIRIEDAGMTVEISWGSIVLGAGSGVKCKVGEVIRETTVLPAETVTLDYEQNGTTFTFEKSYLVFYKQVAPSQYLKLTVTGLMHTNYVYGSHTVETTIADSLDPDNNNFLVPLNRFIVEDLTLVEETELMYASFRIIFNSYKITKTKWYESSFFRIIVMVAIAVITGGAGVGVGAADWAITAMSALGLTGTAAVIAATFLTIAANQLITKAISMWAEELGFEAAIALAAVASVALIAGGTGVEMPSWMPDAEVLMQAVTGLTLGTNNIVKGEYQELMSDIADFESASLEQEEELADAQALLLPQDVLDPMFYVDPLKGFDPDETVGDFYKRTIHTGNPGVLVLSTVEEFIATKLQLPDTKSTITNIHLIGVD